MTALQRERIASIAAWADVLASEGHAGKLEVLRCEVRVQANAAWDAGQDAYGDALWDESDRIGGLIAALDAAREGAQ